MSGAEAIALGSVSFGPAFSPDWRDDEANLRGMYEQACASIIRLECELEEANARIAVLEEEQRILARKHAPRLTDEDDGIETCRHKEAADRIGGNPWSNI